MINNDWTQDNSRYSTNEELYEQTLKEARGLPKSAIKIILRERLAMHSWAIRAYEQALKERAK